MTSRPLITADSEEFRAMFGEELASTISAVSQSPDQQAAARELEAQLSADKRRNEAQELKLICDGADNRVYGKEGQEIAKRFAGDVDGVRSYYMQIGLRDALLKAGLLKRGGKKR